MKLKLKIVSFIFLILFIYINIFNLKVYAQDDNIPNITSPAAILIDQKTGSVLYEKNSDDIRQIASLTKILTAIITIENVDLQDYTTASYYATHSLPDGYSIADIKENESLQIQDLLDVLLVYSANDAAIVLAENFSGTEDEFAKYMTTYAKKLGCTNSHFVNSNGKEQENHYSTARDMAIIMRHCMENETFRQIASKQTASLPQTPYSPQRNFQTTVKLLIPSSTNAKNPYYYEYAIAGKTGFTTNAQNCLVASASKDGLELVCVILGSGKTVTGESVRFYETKDLFEYGFNNYTQKTLLQKDDTIGQMEIQGSDTPLEVYIKDDLVCLVNNDNELNSISKDYIIEKQVVPIEQDELIGKVIFTINDIEYPMPIYAKNSLSQVIKFDGTNSFLSFSSVNTFYLFAFFVIILVIIVICLLFYFANKNTMQTTFNPNKTKLTNKEQKEQKQLQLNMANTAIENSLNTAINMQGILDKKLNGVQNKAKQNIPIKNLNLDKKYAKQLIYRQQNSNELELDNKPKRLNQILSSVVNDNKNTQKIQDKIKENKEQNQAQEQNQNQNQKMQTTKEINKVSNTSNPKQITKDAKKQISQEKKLETNVKQDKQIKKIDEQKLAEPKTKVETKIKVPKENIKETIPTIEIKEKPKKQEQKDNVKQQENVKNKKEQKKETELIEHIVKHKKQEKLPTVTQLSQEEESESPVIDVEKINENKAKNKEAIDAIKKLKQLETDSIKKKKQQETQTKKKQLTKLREKIASENVKEQIQDIQDIQTSEEETSKKRKTKKSIEQGKDSNIEENANLIALIKNRKK